MGSFSGRYGTSNSLIDFPELCASKGIKINHFDADDIATRLISDNEIFAWVQGNYEIGPRALGGRSILASPFIKENWTRINATIKMREDFRPFAPVLLAEDAEILFGSTFKHSPYMLQAPRIRAAFAALIPAATHLDLSCRLQTVDHSTPVRLRETLCAVKQITGWGVLLNTSLNMSGESIIVEIEHVLDFLAITELDGLVFEEFFISKADNRLALQEVAQAFPNRAEYRERRRKWYKKWLQAREFPPRYALYKEIFETLFDQPLDETRDKDCFYMTMPQDTQRIFDYD